MPLFGRRLREHRSYGIETAICLRIKKGGEVKLNYEEDSQHDCKNTTNRKIK